MSFLTTTANMVHATRLPAGTTRAQALAMLSDHEFFLTCDPHLAKYERIPPDEAAKRNPPPSLPDTVRARRRRGSCSKTRHTPDDRDKDKDNVSEKDSSGELLPACYRVTDIVHAVPAGLWDTSVVSDYEFTDLRDGVFVRIRSPLGIVMDTFWEVRAVGDAGSTRAGREPESESESEPELELVEDLTIRCSRLLVGLVRSQCEAGWAKIHARMVKRLAGEL